MASVFLIRHGEVAGNSGERLFYSGWDDVALTSRGIEQAQAVANRLAGEKFDAIYASDLSRARVTAETIARHHGMDVTFDAAWRETDFGQWNGKGEIEIVAGWPELWPLRQADAVNVRPPGGENLLDLVQRVQPAWQSLVGRHEGERIVLVAHQNTIRILLMLLLEIPLRNYQRLRIANCSVSVVQVVAGKTLVHTFNDTHHLREI